MEDILRRPTKVSLHLHQETALRVRHPSTRASASQLLTKLTDLDDVEAYLHTFEIVAENGCMILVPRFEYRLPNSLGWPINGYALASLQHCKSQRR